MEKQVIKEFVQVFNFLAKSNNIDAIDSMFLKLINEDWSKEDYNINKQLIILFLRSNFLINKEINSYPKLLKKSVNYIIEHEENPSTVLCGLI